MRDRAVESIQHVTKAMPKDRCGGRWVRVVQAHAHTYIHTATHTALLDEKGRGPSRPPLTCSHPNTQVLTS